MEAPHCETEKDWRVAGDIRGGVWEVGIEQKQEDSQGCTRKGELEFAGSSEMVPPQPGSVPQVLESGRLGLTSTTQVGRVTMSDWMPSASTMGSVYVPVPCGWRPGPLTGCLRAALARWSMAAPVRASGASTGSRDQARTVPITQCASCAHRVSLNDCRQSLPPSSLGAGEARV